MPKNLKVDERLSYYFVRLFIHSFVDAVAEPRVAVSGPKLIKEGDQYHSYGINLNHNMLTGALNTLPDFVHRTLIYPEALSTLDLSFNVFSEIPIVSRKSVYIYIGDIWICFSL